MDKIIEELFSDIEKKFINFLRSQEIDSEVYACGFWLFYCDHISIAPPCFGYNSTYENEDDQWSPPDWGVDIDRVAYDAISPFYESITTRMEGKPDEKWEELIEYQWKFYTNICIKLNSEIDNNDSPLRNWPKSKDFVIGIFEDREGMYEKLVVDILGYKKAKELRVI